MAAKYQPKQKGSRQSAPGPASKGPNSVPATSCSSQPVATPRSAPGRASRLWLEKLGQPIQGWPDWRARGMAVDLATEQGQAAHPLGRPQQPAPLLWTGGLRQRSAAISSLQRRCPPCNGEAHGYSGQPLTTALSIAARRWDDKGSQADRRGFDPKTRRQQELSRLCKSWTSPFRPENGAEQASLEIQGRTGDPGPASHAESRVEATSAQARVPEKVGPA